MSLETFHLYLASMAFLWGAIWGSFLNVVIYRLPANLSVVSPPSRCPTCKTQLAWHDNVPIFGWLWLRGRCRTCKTPISPRYPAIELLTALLSLATWLHVSAGHLTGDLTQLPGLALAMTFFLYFYFIALLICIAFIDLDETIIPHELTLPGMGLGLLAALVIPRGPDQPMRHLWPAVDWLDALLGAAAGGGVIASIILGYKLLRGREGMGWGDFTLMIMCGLWTGWQGVLFILFAGSLQGLLATLAWTLWRRLRGEPVQTDRFLIKDIDAIDADPTAPLADAPPADAPTAAPDDDPGFGGLAIPFGPFLALAAVEFLLLGHRIIPPLLGF
jgi:leader peptidase (prepilin peptidase)/N-methyltransferase